MKYITIIIWDDYNGMCFGKNSQGIVTVNDPMCRYATSQDCLAYCVAHMWDGWFARTVVIFKRCQYRFWTGGSTQMTGRTHQISISFPEANAEINARRPGTCSIIMNWPHDVTAHVEADKNSSLPGHHISNGWPRNKLNKIYHMFY